MSNLRQVPDRSPWRLTDALLRWEVVLLVLLACVLFVNVRLSPYFLDIYSLSDATLNFSEQAIVVLPMALLILTRDIDLSVAGIIALSSLTMGLCAEAGGPVWLMVVAGLGVGTLCGAINGGLIRYFDLQSIVVTIGTLSVFRGITQIVLGDHALASYPPGFQAIGQGYVMEWPPIPVSLVVFVGLAIVFGVVLHTTRYGRMLYAIGNNPVAARFSGLPVDRIRFILFVLTGLMSGLAAILLTGRVASTVPSIATGWELIIVTMAVLGGFSITGGVGTVLGAVLSVFVIGLISWGLLLANYSGVEVNVVIGALLIVSIATPILATRILRSRRRTS